MTTSDNIEMGITGCCAMLKLQANSGELELNRVMRNFCTGLIIVTPYLNKHGGHKGVMWKLFTLPLNFLTQAKHVIPPLPLPACHFLLSP